MSHDGEHYPGREFGPGDVDVKSDHGQDASIDDLV